MIRDHPDTVTSALESLELSHLLSQAGEAVLHADREGIVTYCNDAYLELSGLTRAQVVGHLPLEFQPSFKRSIFYHSFMTVMRERRPQMLIAFSVLLDRWLLVRMLPTDNGLLMLANDPGEATLQQYQLAQGALVDTMTGLPNKLALVQDMRSRLAAGEPFSVGVLGLNGFKSINDSQGFTQGDEALKEVACRLQGVVLEQERLYRLNGDEFGLLTPRDAAHAQARVREMVEQTRRPLALNRQVFLLGAAASVVHSPVDGTDAEALLTRAMLALRHAKQTKAEDIVVYQPEFEAATRARAQLETELRRAFTTQELMLVLQPKGCLSGRRMVGAEALLRWQHPSRGMVSPAQFLPIAQECGLMPALDRWVLNRALEQIAELERRDLAVPVSINVSVESLADVGFVDCVRQALASTGIDPSMLEIEIPEGALMVDVAASATVLARLHQLGVGLSVDDFGTGYSSFAYLARFPVQTLKVDRSFVNDMTNNEASGRVVEGLINLAHSLSLRVVAEGAETEQQLAMLQTMACDEVQGYGYGRPVPFEQFCDFALRHRLRAAP